MARWRVNFHSRYTNFYLSTLIIDGTDRYTYKHWNNWCFQGSNGRYCFSKGYDEDYAKNNLRG